MNAIIMLIINKSSNKSDILLASSHFQNECRLKKLLVNRMQEEHSDRDKTTSRRVLSDE